MVALSKALGKLPQAETIEIRSQVLNLPLWLLTKFGEICPQPALGLSRELLEGANGCFLLCLRTKMLS